MLARLRTLAVVLAVLFAAGFGSRFLLEERIWQAYKKDQPELQLKDLEEAMGQGVILGLLGGFRALVANALWLRSSYSWEQLDLPQTQTFIQMTVTVDPRPIFFWQNGSRIIGYDMPNWRFDARGGIDVVPEAVQRQIEQEQSAVAIAMLKRGLEFYPGNPLLLIEIANLHQRRLKDVATAAEYYRLASEHPEAPYYAPRIYAELLRQLDRKQEAYDYLLKLLPKLPPDDAFAMAWVVYDRIRELEGELNIPEEKRYKGSRPSVVPL